MLTYKRIFDIINTIEGQMKENATMNINFVFRFPDADTKLNFRVAAAKLNKSMNELLGEIVTRYLEETKRAS